MELVTIRTGRKITAYQYRGVLVTRTEYNGVTLWEWTQTRLDGPQLRQVKTKDAFIATIDRSLKPGGRDWYGKPVEYVAHDGQLIDVRLIGGAQ